MSGPDRIFAKSWIHATHSELGVWSATHHVAAVEYIRRDPAVLAALPEVRALIAVAVERSTNTALRNLRDTFEAMCAMRNDINEYITMPSLESDLLQGPENSVFCEQVGTAVIDAITARDAMIAEAETRALDSVTTLHTVIAYIRAATVGDRPMLSDLAAALVAWRDEAAAKEREACAQEVDDWFYDPASDELTDRRLGDAIRKRGEG